MAHKRKQAQAQQGPAMLVMALILFTATADAQILSPIIGGLLNLTGLIVSGGLYCTPDGNYLPGSPGVPGVPVQLNCTNLAGVSVQVGQGTTNIYGIYNISVSLLPEHVRDIFENIISTCSDSIIPQCFIKILRPLIIPVATVRAAQPYCLTLGTAQGVLTGVPSVLNGIVQGVSGLIGNFSVPFLTLNATVQV